MPDFPIVDTHVHIYDPDRIALSGFRGNALLDRAHNIEDYAAALGDVAVEAMVFVECYADFDAQGGQYLDEIAFVEEAAAREPRLRGLVPMAPLERGARVTPLLDEMQDMHPLVKGIRRIIEFDADPRALALSPDFITGVNLLARRDLHFEINVNYRQMDIIRDFVRRIPDTRMILDHCGKPGIRDGALAQFRTDVAELARAPNLWIKLSDLPVEADRQHWTESDLRPYIDATIETFGPDRMIFGGDWPVCLQATSLPRWVEVLDRALAGLSETDHRKIYRDNADRFYRLGLGGTGPAP